MTQRVIIPCSILNYENNLTFLVLDAIWAGDQLGEIIWAKIGPLKVDTFDLQTLAPGEELSANVSLALCSSVRIGL